MYSLNRAQVIGNLTRDPELKQLPSGVAVASFTVATNQVWNDANGVRQEKAEFHDIVAWRKLAEICGQVLKKGGKAYVEGKLQTREWTGEDGVKRRKTEIVAENVISLERASGNGGGGYTPSALASSSSYDDNAADPLDDNADQSGGDSSGDDVAIDDLPF